MRDRGPARQSDVDDLAGAAPSARGQAVPQGEQDVAMRDGCPPRHDERPQLIVEPAGKLQHAAGAADELVEAGEPRIVQRAPVRLAVERQDRLQFESEVERDLGGDLVTTIGERRHEQQARRAIGEALPLADVERERLRLQLRQCGPQPFDDALGRILGKRLDAMARDADAEHERKPRRVGRSCLRSRDRAALDVHRMILARRRPLRH